jgi:hypothetical protein
MQRQRRVRAVTSGRRPDAPDGLTAREGWLDPAGPIDVEAAGPAMRLTPAEREFVETWGRRPLRAQARATPS